MFVVLDSTGFVLGTCLDIANILKIVAVKETPYVPKDGSITFEASDGEMITIVDSTPVEMLPVPTTPLINDEGDIWDNDIWDSIWRFAR